MFARVANSASSSSQVHLCADLLSKFAPPPGLNRAAESCGATSFLSHFRYRPILTEIADSQRDRSVLAIAEKVSRG